MKNVLVYDGNCPACRAYTKGFVWMGLLSPAGRQSNCTIQDAQVLERIDRQRARNEIPLVDLDSGKTHYGVDALLTVLATRWPRFSAFFRKSGWFNASQALYAFVSSNRRIIAPPKPGRWELMDLQPDFRPGLRSIFVALLFACILSAQTFLLGHIDGPFLALIMGQILVVWMSLWLTRSPNWLETLLDYAGHLGMSLLLGGVFKLMGFTLHQDWLIITGSALVIGQHFIRTNLLGLSPWLSVLFTAWYLFITNGH